jgi:Flp pilus assembly protein TadB
MRSKRRRRRRRRRIQIPRLLLNVANASRSGDTVTQTQRRTVTDRKTDMQTGTQGMSKQIVY